MMVWTGCLIWSEKREARNKRAGQKLRDGVANCKGWPCGGLFITAAYILVNNTDIILEERFLCKGIRAHIILLDDPASSDIRPKIYYPAKSNYFMFR